MAEILNGVYPEPMAEILHFVQNDRRRVQNDKHGISVITTQSLDGGGPALWSNETYSTG